MKNNECKTYCELVALLILNQSHKIQTGNKVGKAENIENIENG